MMMPDQPTDAGRVTDADYAMADKLIVDNVAVRLTDEDYGNLGLAIAQALAAARAEGVREERAKLADARAVIAKHEWAILTTTDCGYVVHWCAECGGYRPYDYDEVGPSRNWPSDLRGHRPGCAVKAVIGGAS